MDIENLNVESKLGRSASYPHRHHLEDKSSLAVLFPGLAYTKDSPLMWYSAIAAYEAGYDTLSIEYGFQANHVNATRDAIELSIEEAKTTLKALQKKKGYRHFIFISKSIGTVISQGIPEISGIQVNDFIFMTPLSQTVTFIKSAGRILVLVGTADPAFRDSDIEQITGLKNVSIVTFPDADHSLEVEGDYGKSLSYLKKATDSCFNFCSSSRQL